MASTSTAEGGGFESEGSEALLVAELLLLLLLLLVRLPWLLLLLLLQLIPFRFFREGASVDSEEYSDDDFDVTEWRGKVELLESMRGLLRAGSGCKTCVVSADPHICTIKAEDTAQKWSTTYTMERVCGFTLKRIQDFARKKTEKKNECAYETKDKRQQNTKTRSIQLESLRELTRHSLALGSLE